MKRNEIQPGHFYALGIGPGASDLVTLRAAKLIESADIIIAPRSEKSETSLALATIQPWVNNQEIIEHTFAMTRDLNETLTRWKGIARLIAERCEQGQSVVQITLGDPLLYSTSYYLLELTRELMPPQSIHVVPGVSAFQSAASLFGETLTIQEDRLLLMPATDLDAVEKALGHCETLVLYKVGKKLSQLIELLERKELLEHAQLACYCEQADRELLATDLRGVDPEQGYLATVIVRIGRKEWQ